MKLKNLATVESSRELQQSEIEWIRQFLIGLKVSQGESNMGKMTREMKHAENMHEARQPIEETCNMVFLAGKIYKIDVRDKYAWVLLTTGDRGKVPFKCFEKELLKQLENFSEQDFIRIVGRVGQMKNQEGKYDLTVVLTTIKSPIPQKSHA